MRVGFGVVLVVVNLLAFLVLLMFDLVVLSRRQVTAIFLAIGFRLVVNPGFVVFDVPGFTRRQLPGLHSLIDPILLAILASVHAHAFRVSRRAVVDRRIIAAVHSRGALVRNLDLRARDVLLVHVAALFGASASRSTAARAR